MTSSMDWSPGDPTLRERAGRLTQEERDAALARGLELIYAGPALAAKDAQIADLRGVIQGLLTRETHPDSPTRRVLVALDPVPLIEVLERTRPS